MDKSKLEQLIKEEIHEVVESMAQLPAEYTAPYLDGYRDAILFMTEAYNQVRNGNNHT